MHPGEATTRTFAPLLERPADGEKSPPRGAPPLVRLRWVIAAIIVGLAAFSALRLWFVEGLLRPATIDGPSMAPLLLPAHFAVTCGDCGFRFACDAEHPPPAGQAVCPNCGYAGNDLAGAKARPEDRVLIDRWQLIWRSAGRGEIVAARLPAGELVVKRVAALPGERLAIREGDLHANEKLIRKTPAEWRLVRVLVHDNDYQPRTSAGLPPRWTGGRDSRWRADGAGFVIAENQAAGDIDWLAYQHWPGTGNPLVPREEPTPIRDLDGFNQGQTNRQLQPVHDVQLTCRLKVGGEGSLALAAVDRGRRLVVQIDPAGRRLTAVAGEVQLAARDLASDLFRYPVELEFGLCDQQVLLTIDRRTLLCVPYDRFASSGTFQSPLEIGTRGLGLELTQLKVWRDIHYLPPSGLAEPWQAASALGSSQFALLGDNPPVSIDSRQWQPAGVPARSILGRVYRPFWASGD